MFYFSKRSLDNLATCDIRLQKIAQIAIKHVDFAVIEGHRTKERQNALLNETPPKTTLQWPKSKHNSNPSLAFDLLPHPYNWNDREAFIRFAAFIIGIGAGLGYNILWGGDWDRDWDLKDNRFNDFPHFELVE